MAFEFKEFSELLTGSRGFTTRVIPVIQEKNNVKDVVSLEDPRKSQIQFIQLIINKLNASDASAKRKSQILSGAMMLIINVINQEMGLTQHNSQLRDLLSECVGIDDENKPSHEQVAKSYRALTGFLSFIYVDKDPKNNLVTEYSDPKIELDTLLSFVKSSYKLDKDESIKATRKLKTATTPDAGVQPSQFEASVNLPAKFKEQIKSWSELRTAVKNLINAEIAKKGAGSTKAIAGPRGIQLQFLENTLDNLDSIVNTNTSSASAAVSAGASSNSNSSSSSNTKKKNNGKEQAQSPTATASTAASATSATTTSKIITDDQKAAILIGAMLIVRGQINGEYRHSLLSKQENTSTIHTKITEILDANHQSLEDIKNILSLSNNYFGFLTICKADDKDINSASVMRASHVYSKIQGFNLIDLLNQVQEMIFICRTKVLEACEPKKEHKKKASVMGGFNFFTGGKAQAKKDDSDLDDDDDETPASTAAAASGSSSTSTNVI